MTTKGGGGVEGGGWQTVGKGSQKRGASKERPEMSEAGAENKLRKMGSVNPEELVVLFKVKGQKPGEGGFRVLNPLRVTTALESQIGKGFQAKILSNGILRVCCVNQNQYDSTKEVGKIVARVERVVPNEKKGPKGVIYGVYSGLSEQEILDNIKGGSVVGVMRFKRKEGDERDSPVLLTFAGNVLPEVMYLGSMAYRVREYIRPPLRCFNCQRFGHTASSCRGKRRCAKCGQEHEIKECKAETSRCCNCGGDHMAAFRGCEHFIQAKQIQSNRDQNKVSYMEAVRRGGGEIGAQNIKMSGSVIRSQRAFPALPVMSPDMLVLSRDAFLAFITDVLVGAKSTMKRSDMIKIVVGAAERFLGVSQLSPEKLHEYMTEKQHLDSSQLVRPDSMETQIESNDAVG